MKNYTQSTLKKVKTITEKLNKKIFFYTLLIIINISIVQALPTPWENIVERFNIGDFWQQGEELTAETFNSITEQVIANQNFDNFLSLFGVVVDKVIQIEEKFASISSDVNGNIGIGNINPEAQLHIKRAGADTLVLENSNTGGTKWSLSPGESAWFPDTFLIRDRTNNADSIKFAIKTNGNIGIGTETPNEKLEVNGNIKANDIETKNPWHNMLMPPGFSSYDNVKPKCRKVNGWIEFRGTYSIYANNGGWPLGTFLLLPEECRPKTRRYTEMPCHSNTWPRNIVCNNDFHPDGNVGIHSDYGILQLRFDGVKIWGEED